MAPAGGRAATPVLQGEAAAALARRRVRRRLTPAGPRLRRLAAHPSRVVAALSAAGLVAMVLWIAMSGHYRIHGASVTGNARVSAPAVYAASGLEGASVFTVDVNEAESRILALDGIRGARVQVGLPARAAIAVEESRPVLLWQTEGVVLAVDEQGLAVPPPLSGEGLVPVHDLAGTLQAPGERITPQQVAAALAFGARFGLHLAAGDGLRGHQSRGLGGTPGQQRPSLPRVSWTSWPPSARSWRAAVRPWRSSTYASSNRPYYRLRGESE